MAVAEVFDSAVSISCRLPVGGSISNDGQTTTLPMECLYSWSCTYPDGLTCCVTDERLCQLPRLLVSLERALGMDGIPATEFVCFSFDFRLTADSYLPLSALLCMKPGAHFVSRILYRLHWRTTKICGLS